MKMITCVIRPFKMNDAKDALQTIGVKGLTVTEVKGYGKQKGHTEIYRGAEYTVDLVPKLKLEVLVNDEEVDNVIESLILATRTPQIGDGKIFVYNIENAIRIRTGESDQNAIE